MAWETEPTDRTHGPYLLKLTADVTHPTMTEPEVRQWLTDTLLVLAHDRVQSKMRDDFQRPWIGAAPYITVLSPGVYQLYPKIVFRANLKRNRDEWQAVREIYADLRTGAQQTLESAGFTVLELKNKSFP